MNLKSLPWILATVFGLGLGLLYSLYANAKREQHIAESNEKAALDTTRISLVGNLQAASHLIEQQSIQVSGLKGALAAALKDRKSDARVLQGFRLTVDSLNKLHQAPVAETTDTSGVRTVTFDQVGPPIQGTQIVTAPLAPRSIMLESHLEVTPFDVRYGLGCDKNHTPVASFETPEWVQTSFQQGAVDPGVCNPKGPGFFSFNLAPSLGNILYGLAGGLLVFVIRR